MPKKKELTVQTYLDAMHRYGKKIQGGTIHQVLKMSKVRYYGRKCPDHQVECGMNGTRAVVGGNYATNGPPVLEPCQQLDFV